jgi:hypothetical protein
MLSPLGAGSASEIGAGFDLLFTVGFVVLAVLVASWRFSREESYEPLIHILTGKRGG